jgi:hypothetical protein
MLTLFFTQMGTTFWVTPLTLSILAILVFLLWGVFSLILRYHWSRYASSKLHILQMNLIYYGGSTVLFALAFLFLILYTFSSSSL